MTTCIIVIGSLSPANSRLMAAVDRLPVSDKTLHFTAYLVLAGLAVLAFSRPLDALFAAGSMALLGVLLEFGQYFSPGRTPDVWDEVANVLGVICGIALAFPFRRSRLWAGRVWADFLDATSRQGRVGNL
jgi:VanZ family protein